MSDLSLETYKFIAIWVEAIFWGMYTILFGICMYVLLSARKRFTTGAVNKPFLATATILYLLSTIHFLNDFARGYIGFLEYGDKGGPKKYYEEISVWHYLLREAIYMTTNVVADALLIYRLYIVWGRKKRFAAAPLVLLTATAVFGYLTVWGFSRVEPGLIAWRIWWTGREMSNTLDDKHGHKHSQALVIVVESGAMCSIALMLNLVLYVTRRNAVQITFDSTAQIMGIAPTLTIVRVGLGLSRFKEYTTDFCTLSMPGRLTTTANWHLYTYDHSVADPESSQMQYG